MCPQTFLTIAFRCLGDNSSTLRWCCLLLGWLVVCGCGKSSPSHWHAKFDWKADEYFDDPQVIQLCQAIEANDLAEMERLIQAGADVNAQGKGKMTPLLWAFPGNKPERFKKLLEHGADPNVIVESDFNTRHTAIVPGDSVTVLAARSSFPEHFGYVMEHGGNPNQTNPETKCTLLRAIIMEGGPQVKERIKLLIEKGADLNATGGSSSPPVMDAVGFFGQFDVALLLLEAGADPNIYMKNHVRKLTHIVVLAKKGLATMTPQQRADFEKLVEWLEDHGQSIAEAEADFERWKKWPSDRAAKSRLIDAEIAERKAKEAAAKQSDASFSK